MTNREKLLAALDKRRSDPAFVGIMGELEHHQMLNEERDEDERFADDAEVFMADIADKDDDPAWPARDRRGIREILIEAGFYKPFDEEGWRSGRIIYSSSHGHKPWAFTLRGVKYDNAFTYSNFLD